MLIQQAKGTKNLNIGGHTQTRHMCKNSTPDQVGRCVNTAKKEQDGGQSPAPKGKIGQTDTKAPEWSAGQGRKHRRHNTCKQQKKKREERES